MLKTHARDRENGFHLRPPAQALTENSKVESPTVHYRSQHHLHSRIILVGRLSQQRLWRRNKRLYQWNAKTSAFRTGILEHVDPYSVFQRHIIKSADSSLETPFPPSFHPSIRRQAPSEIAKQEQRSFCNDTSWQVPEANERVGIPQSKKRGQGAFNLLVVWT
ncbi:uncharacterized protein BKA78DRAFT_324069 [Phyllosticta capitalensis]|uniref:uncharacterized protein n=1 Tax=Phyllosticta capitalensis TaxID=121624 RepID=UPI0031301933